MKFPSGGGIIPSMFVHCFFWDVVPLMQTVYKHGALDALDVCTLFFPDVGPLMQTVYKHGALPCTFGRGFG